MSQVPPTIRAHALRWVASILLGLLGIAALIYSLVNSNWLITAVSFVLIALAIGIQSKPTELEFSVGESANLHIVVFKFNKFWGKLTITVDGQAVVRDLRFASTKRIKAYTFPIDSHVVRIEKKRFAVLAGTRPQDVTAYVDDLLVAKKTV